MYIPDVPETITVPATLANGTSVNITRTVDRYRIEKVILERLATMVAEDSIQLRFTWSKGYIEDGVYYAVHGMEIRIEGSILDSLLELNVNGTLRSVVSKQLWTYLRQNNAIGSGKIIPSNR